MWGLDGTNGALGTLKKLDARLIIVEQTISLAKWLALLCILGLTLAEKKSVAEVILTVLKIAVSAS